MIRSVMALCHSRMGRFVGLAIATASLSAISTPATANSAATASDSFRISDKDLKANETALGTSDPEFRALHESWGKATGNPTKIEVAVPSIDPVRAMRVTSQFGPRRAPTRGASRNHKGIDFGGPIGTPIYATADGIVGRARWVGGYGKFIELEHGNQLQTRYGHLSAMNVRAGQRVRKGDVIGFMGSTGRSTGSHLHYEVRIGGVAVNPLGFLTAPIKHSPIKPKQLLARANTANNGMGGASE